MARMSQGRLCPAVSLGAVVAIVLTCQIISYVFYTQLYANMALTYQESLGQHHFTDTTDWNHVFTSDAKSNHQTRTYRVIDGVNIEGKENRSLQVLLKRGNVEPASINVSSDTKVILWYIPTRFHPVLSKLHPLRGCPEKPCRVTTNRYFYNQSDALVFTAQLVRKGPPAKLPNQVWILHNHESPKWAHKTLPLYEKEWRSQFNWTMDYRDDSDIEAPYGLIRKKNGHFVKRYPPISKNYTMIMSEKYSGPNATIAWMSSHCETHGKRLQYVEEMSKYIKVDIYGGCGSHKCPRSDDERCLQILSQRYKFYLAFENAFCKDYITEKMFRFYNTDTVVIVRGGGNYSRVIPPGTYLNTADFRSPKHLAEYLNMLNKNDNKYIDILKEKNKYEALMEDWPIVQNGHIIYMTYHYDSMPMCNMCDRLWNVDKYKKHYHNISKWFLKGACYPPNDIVTS